MGPKERRERERENVRALIIDAARDLFVSEGYEAVTMRRIADRIEYSPTAIYLHFRDKEAVIRAVCDADFYALARELITIAEIADPIEKLRLAGVAYARFGLERRNHYRLMFMTPHPPMPPEESGLAHGNPEEDAYAFLLGITTECVAKGLLRPELEDPHLVAQIVWSSIHGIVSLEIAKCNDGWIDWIPMDTRLLTAIDVLVRGISRTENN